ncbi:methyl-accepting chemotaxis protein [Geminocystis sp. NIES-3709]|uniref:methyl-accepting chemotaxis protein n=1 Tax=Geminocystis sp. NIES-3709 TaxID=1617448 RepID=UPI0005FC70C5|nr:methyl-accepting chemotaxis protein [Geminocystis sp. NIES-3709]BAQ66865.1 hypothetical protein GM3709_3630 [Geminocystis sp. NIES-3709]
MISQNATFPLEAQSSEKEDISFKSSGQNNPESENKIKKGGTFRQRLLTTILPTTLIPLIVASSITINITGYRAERDELNRLEEIAVLGTVGSLTSSKNGVALEATEVSSKTLQEVLSNLLKKEIVGTRVLQIIDVQTGNLLNSIVSETLNIPKDKIVEGEAITQVAKILLENQSNNNFPELLSQLNQIPNLAQIDLRESQNIEGSPTLTFRLNKRYFKILSIPETNVLAVISVDEGEIFRAGNQLALIFGSLTFFLAILAVASVILLAQNFSEPLINLTNKAKQVAQGDLEVEATLEGTEENRILAYNFNSLVQRVKELIKEQEAIANEQKEEKEKLEMGIYQLLDDLQGAVEGDLTVRASLSSMEMSTVADLCNAILDNLQDIASQVQKSSNQVIFALEKDEESIKELTKGAIEENYKTIDTLVSVKNMSETISKIAQSANQAATLADDAYSATEESSKGMDATVSTIFSLRNTVGETAKKMKRLGESSQKISQVVSLIEEIALKTNLLAINATVEANRAGEQGQGFTVIAEQVGALAEQSASATKEIAKIVAEIQQETQEVTNAMEMGTTQVVSTTQLVETTKQQLEQVLTRSRNINQLMQSISQSTVSQAQTSQTVQELMEQIAHKSEERLEYSQKIVKSIQGTSQIAQQLELAVEQFKVSE